MNVRRDKEALLLQLHPLEAVLLHRILSVILENYRVGPADLDPQTAEAWYSARGCETAGLSADETRDWLAALHQHKTECLPRIDDWAAALARPKASGQTLRVALHDADAFLTAINDYRLLPAARHHIGEAEMNLRTDRAVENLPPARRAALMEIHFLAWLIEETLTALDQG